jgi:histidine ammonia-lyase
MLELIDGNRLQGRGADGKAVSVVFGAGRILLEDVIAIAGGHCGASLCDTPEFIARIRRGSAFLDRLLEQDGVIYGVTTGYGDSCTVAIPPHLVEELPLHLTRFHGCGLGDYFAEDIGLAVLATRLNSLSLGYSGVRPELLAQLAALINKRIVPRIPQEGSVGASGDLTPLSYVAAALIGEREVYCDGAVIAASEALRRFDIAPLQLRPKEGLAIMNGTAVMTAIACMAYARAEYLTQLCARITALATLALDGNRNHFDELLFSVKPHAGQNQIAGWIRNDLQHQHHTRNSQRLQDRYSIRCAPHIIGVLRDALPFFRTTIENELNSANDNPIIDGEGEHVLHGGHFYGGHIAFVMDSMKTAVANLADLLDRQMALLMDTKFNNGLPANLSGADASRAMINHGFKAVQIGASAWTAEALKLTMPASVFSRSTECHNQDKVSMGTIAARDCLRVLQLTEQVAASALLAATQALELRQRKGELDAAGLTTAIRDMHKQVLGEFAFVTEDRPLEADLRATVARIQQRYWALY